MLTDMLEIFWFQVKALKQLCQMLSAALIGMWVLDWGRREIRYSFESQYKLQ